MIKIGYNELDKLIQLNKGNLIAIASRPKNGKTTLVFNKCKFYQLYCS